MPDSSRIEDLRRRVQSDPASIAFAQLAEEYRRARQYQESIKVCQTGLRLHPRYLSARITLGRALIELGRLDEAREELETVIKSEPRNVAAIRALAEAHRRRGAWSDALEQYRAALELASNDPDLERAVTDMTTKSRVSAELFGTPDHEPQSGPVIEHGRSGPVIERDRKVIASLERWLTAIHVTRADRRP